MRTPRNIRLVKPLFIACMLHFGLFCHHVDAVNPKYDDGSSSPDCPDCDETCTDSASSPPVSSSQSSIDIVLNAGRAGYERPNVYSALFTAAGENVGDKRLAQGMKGLETYFNKAPVKGVFPAELRLKTEVINAAAFSPASLTYNSAMKMTVLKETNGAIRQVLTKDFLVDIQLLTDIDEDEHEGYIAKWYAAKDQTLPSSGLITPVGKVLKIARIRNPNTAGIYNKLELSTMVDSGVGSPRYELYRYDYSDPDLRIFETYPADASGLPATQNPVAKEIIDYITGPLSETVDTEKRTVTRWVSDLSASGDSGGLEVESRVLEVYKYVAGKRRLMSLARLSSPTAETVAAGDPVTTYGYYEDTGNAQLDGRPRWRIEPDGSWIVWDITAGNSIQIKEIIPFENAVLTINNGVPSYNENECQVVTSVYAGPQKTVTTRVLGITVASGSEMFLTGNGGERVLKTIRNDGRADHVSYVAHNAYGNGQNAKAGRIAWEKREDGTATAYTYTTNGYGGITVKKVSGASSSTDEKSAPTITAGECEVTEYGPYLEEFSWAKYDGITEEGTALAEWEVTPLNWDDFGRPKDKVWKFGVLAGGSELFEYECCGLKKHTDRDGSVTTTYRDFLKRVYKVESQTAAASPAVTTLTARVGLATTLTRGGIFVSETIRSLNGLTTTTVSPSRNSNSSADRLVTRSVTNPVTRTTTQAYQVGTWNEESNGILTQTTTNYRDGRIASATDEEGHITTYTYGVSAITGGLLTTATSGALVSETHTDRLGRTRRTVSPGSGPTTYIYYAPGDTAGRRGQLQSVTDADGVATTYDYNSKGERTTTTRTVPVGGNYAATNLVTTTTRSVGTAPTIHGDEDIGTCYIEQTQIGAVAGSGVTVSTTYRSLDGLTSANVTLTGNTLSVTTRPTTTSGGTTTTTHPDGTITHTTTSLDRTVVTTARYAKDTDLDADPPPAPIASTTSTFDSLGRLLTVTDSRTGVAGRTTYSNFTESGTPLKTTTPNGDTVTTLDLLGRTTETYLPGHTSENPRVTYASYYPSGRVQARWGFQTYPTYNIYNGEGQLTELRTYRNLATSPVAANGGPVTTGSPAITTWNYSPTTGLLTSKLDNDSKGPSYTYTAAGRIKTRLWARGRLTAYAYTNGLLTAVTHTGTDTTWQTYLTARATYNTVEGNPASTEEDKAAALAAMNTAYAAFSSTADTATPPVAMTYDSLGRRKSVTNTLAASVFEYADDLGVDKETITYSIPGQPVFIRVLDRRARSFGRDTGFTLGIVTDTDSDHSVTYGYAPSTGRLETVANSADTFTYGYLPGSSLLKTITKSASSGNQIFEATRAYETTRDTLASIQNKTGDTIRSSYDYFVVNGGVNSIGQRMGVRTAFDLGGAHTHNSGDTSWGYDNLGQLKSANHNTVNTSDRAYQYDTIGNRLFSEKGSPQIPATPGVNTTSYTPNALNQYDAITPHIVNGEEVIPGTPFEPVFDDDGNMKVGPLSGTGGSSANRLDWDAENRLLQVRDANNTTVITTTFYDAQFRRIATTAGTGGATTLYLYDGFNCIAEYSKTDTAAPALSRTHTWGLDLSGTFQGAGGVGGLLAVTIGGTPYYPAFDGNGNVSEYLNHVPDDPETTGVNEEGFVVAAHFEYDPFGNTVINTDNDNLFPYRFSTKPLDFATGLFYYTYRWYDPVTGRWPSRDPIQEKGGINLYEFVGNDSVNTWDFLGAFKGVNDNIQFIKDVEGKPCNICCIKCKKTGDDIKIEDNGSIGTDVKLKLTSPTFESVWKDNYSPKKGEDCCGGRIVWATCYSGKCYQHGNAGTSLHLKDRKPIKGAPRERGLATSIMGYWWCSCEYGIWRCHDERTNELGETNVVFGPTFEPADLNDYSKGWKISPPSK